MTHRREIVMRFIVLREDGEPVRWVAYPDLASAEAVCPDGCRVKAAPVTVTASGRVGLGGFNGLWRDQK